jgi:hypothetical protein
MEPNEVAGIETIGLHTAPGPPRDEGWGDDVAPDAEVCQLALGVVASRTRLPASRQPHLTDHVLNQSRAHLGSGPPERQPSRRGSLELAGQMRDWLA